MTQISTATGKTVAEFFAGIGLMRMGLEQAGWVVRYANDIDSDKRDMYLSHFSNSAEDFVLGDIHKLDAGQIPSVTLATASFPCNDLSLAGMRKGLSGKQSSAFWGFIRVLKDWGKRRPPFVLLENVAGFLTSHQGRDFHAALEALNKLGYLVDAMIVDAERFVPQSRVRLFVVGASKDLWRGDKGYEMRSFYQSDVRPKALADFMFENPDIDWMFRKLPNLPRRTEVLTSVLEDLPEDSPMWWSRDRTQYLVDQMSCKHAQTLRKMVAGREWSYGTVFRRVRNGKSMAELRTDGVAGCLRTPRGGSGRQILVKAGFDEVKARLLTPRECARLMGAGDFRMNTSMNKALFGFGDAVCVPVIKWLADYCINPLFEEAVSLARDSKQWEMASAS